MKTVFYTTREQGFTVLSDDPALMSKLKAQLEALQTGLKLWPFTPKYPTALQKGPHLYKVGIKIPVPLTTEMRALLLSSGAQDLYAKAPSNTSPAGFGAAQPPLNAQSTPPAATKPHSPSPPHAQQSAIGDPPPFSEVERKDWSKKLNRWLDREHDRVCKVVGSWRIPHAELRQMIHSGLLEQAQDLIEELSRQNPQLVDLYRYLIWITHARKEWASVVEHYETYADQLGSGPYLRFVAEAYLFDGKPAEAGQVLMPFLGSGLPLQEEAHWYVLAAQCHEALGEVDAARSNLMRVWEVLDADLKTELLPFKEQLEPPTPQTLLEPVLNENWKLLLDRWSDPGVLNSLEAYYELERRVATTGSPVPDEVTLLLARMAALQGKHQVASEQFWTLWDKRNTLSLAVMDEVREFLIRDAAKRGNFTGIPALVEGWQGIRDEPLLLLVIAKGHVATGDEDTAEKYFELALSKGHDNVEALTFLAEKEIVKYDQTRHMDSAIKVHELYTRLVAFEPGALQPTQAENWLLVLEEQNLHKEATEAINNVMNAVQVEDYPHWLSVFQQRLSHLRKHKGPGLAVAQAAAEALLAEQMGGASSGNLIRTFNTEFHRLKTHQNWEVLLTYLEGVEAIDDTDLRTQIMGKVEPLLQTELKRGPGINHDLVLRLLMLVFTVKGVEAYQEMNHQYQDQVRMLQQNKIAFQMIDTSISLKGRKVALVGGHESWQKAALDELCGFFGADRSQVVRIPPSWEVNKREGELSQTLHNCDLILVMWRCMKHDTSKMLRNLITKGVVSGKNVHHVAGTGGKGFIREVRNLFG